jgi:hypothetical protein
MSKEYTEAEMDLILSLSPTAENIDRLTKVLGRRKTALDIIYIAAFGGSKFPLGKAINRKVLAAKKRLGIVVGRKTPRRQKTKDSHG